MDFVTEDKVQEWIKAVDIDDRHSSPQRDQIHLGCQTSGGRRWHDEDLARY
jgi:hypothetical protein